SAFCRSLNPLIAELRSSNVPGFALDKFVTVYSGALSRHLSQADAAETSRAYEEFTASFALVRSGLSNVPRGDRSFSTADIFDDEIQIMGNIFLAYEICLRLPDRLREGTEIARAETYDKNLAAETGLEKVIDDEVRSHERYNRDRLEFLKATNESWPYVLV